MQKIIKIRPYDINFVLKDASLLATLRSLTLHSYSGLNHELNNFLQISKIRKVNAKVIIAYLNDIEVGWALLSKEASTFHFRGGTSYNEGYGILFEVFVSPTHRRHGIGSALLKKAKLMTSGKRLCIAPHDYQSEKFYEKNKNSYYYKEL